MNRQKLTITVTKMIFITRISLHLTQEPRTCTSSDVLYYHWLPVRCRIEFKTAALCFKAVRLDNPT